jgi:hypothetical protein
MVKKGFESACWYGAKLVADALVPGAGRAVALLRTTTSFAGALASFAGGRGLDIKVPVMTDAATGFSVGLKANVLGERHDPSLGMIVDFDPFEPPRPGEAGIEAARRRNETGNAYFVLASSSAVGGDGRVDATGLERFLTTQRGKAWPRRESSTGPFGRPPGMIFWADPAADVGLLAVVAETGRPYCPILFTVDRTDDGPGTVRLRSLDGRRIPAADLPPVVDAHPKLPHQRLPEALSNDPPLPEVVDVTRDSQPAVTPVPSEAIHAPARDTPSTMDSTPRQRAARPAARSRARRPRRMVSRRPVPPRATPGPSGDEHTPLTDDFWAFVFRVVLESYDLNAESLQERHRTELGCIEEDLRRELTGDEIDARGWIEAVTRARRSANLVGYHPGLQGYVLLGIARRLCAATTTVAAARSIIDDLFSSADLASPLS